MIKLRLFLNDPKGKTSESYMFPRLGEKYNLQIETISKTSDAYRIAEYQATCLPMLRHDARR